MTPKIMMKMAQMASALELEEKKVNQSLALRKVSMTPLLKTILTINSRAVSTMAQRTVSISQDISKSL
jgi:3-hydroxy-3-methylglutaryl CoA synthase